MAASLIALDEDDLAVVSAHVQDAVVRIGDIVWRRADKRLVLGMNRLDCEQALAGASEPRRLPAALRFERVLSCKARDIDFAAADDALEVIGVEFHPTDPPGGFVALMFADGAALRLDVECLECELADLGAPGRAAEPARS